MNSVSRTAAAAREIVQRVESDFADSNTMHEQGNFEDSYVSQSLGEWAFDRWTADAASLSIETPEDMTAAIIALARHVDYLDTNMVCDREREDAGARANTIVYNLLDALERLYGVDSNSLGRRVLSRSFSDQRPQALRPARRISEVKAA